MSSEGKRLDNEGSFSVPGTVEGPSTDGGDTMLRIPVTDRQDRPISPSMAVPSSAPMAHGGMELSALPQETIRFLTPDMQSFDEFKAKRESWIRRADTDADFLTLVREDPGFVEANAEWLWRPNAVTEIDLLKAANNTDKARKYTNNKSFGTKVSPGEILFARNRNRQKVYGQGVHNFLGSWTKREGGAVDLYGSTLIKRDIITIVNLQPNQIAIALSGNQPVVLLPGRHAYHDPDFILEEKDIITMKDMGPTIDLHCVTIVRIGDWECGLAYIAGSPVLLQPGTHVSRSPAFQFVRVLDTRTFGRDVGGLDMQTCVTHDNICIVKVPQSLYGTGFIAGEPVLMLPGLHMYNNPSFEFTTSVGQAQAHLQHENLHIIQIKPDQIGLAFQGSDPFLMNPGVWHKTSPLFRFVGFRRAAEPVIEHASITRYVVNNGEIGFAKQDGHVCEVAPGVHYTNDPNFKFYKSCRLSDPVIQFGNVAHVTTREGMKRPVFVDGKLVILSAGYNKFVEPNLIVGEAFPTGEIIKPITTMEVLTRDRTPMLVTGQVTYQIRNASDLILNLGYTKLESYIEHTLSAILRHAFSITDLSTIAPDSDKSTGNNGEDPASVGPIIEPEPAVPAKDPLPLFKRDNEEAEGQNFRSELITEIHKELSRNTRSWGIEIHEVAISDIQFKDQEVADKLAAATSNTRTAEAEFDLTLAQSKIRLEKAMVDAKEKLILQKNETQIERIDTEARSQLRLIEERANAEAEIIRKQNGAKAESIKITMLAQATRDAALLEAEGAKARAEAQIAEFSDPSLMRIRMMELWVQGAECLAKTPTPQVLLQSGGGGDHGGGAGLLDVFRKQGKHLLSAALGGKRDGGLDDEDDAAAHDTDDDEGDKENRNGNIVPRTAAHKSSKARRGRSLSRPGVSPAHRPVSPFKPASPVSVSGLTPDQVPLTLTLDASEAS